MGRHLQHCLRQQPMALLPPARGRVTLPSGWVLASAYWQQRLWLQLLPLSSLLQPAAPLAVPAARSAGGPCTTPLQLSLSTLILLAVNTLLLPLSTAHSAGSPHGNTGLSTPAMLEHCMQLWHVASYSICRDGDGMHAIHPCLTAQRSGASACHMFCVLDQNPAARVCQHHSVSSSAAEQAGSWGSICLSSCRCHAAALLTV